MGRRNKKITPEDAEELLMETDPVILETDPKMKDKVVIGTMVNVLLPQFGKIKGMQKRQFDDGVVKVYGQIKLEDGTILEPGKLHTVSLTGEIKRMLLTGYLMGGMRSR